MKGRTLVLAAVASSVASLPAAAADPPVPEPGEGTNYAGRATLSATYTSGNTESERLYADAEFTAMAMNVFVTFGFQMIVATPLKSVMTLEPFIGGACFVHIKDRKKSAVIPIDYDAETRRLKLTPEVRHAEEAPVT